MPDANKPPKRVPDLCLLQEDPREILPECVPRLPSDVKVELDEETIAKMRDKLKSTSS